MKFSMVIPVYHEADHLKEFLEGLVKIKFPIEVEYIVIDDHSKDDSFQIAESFAAQCPEMRVLRQDRNQGKGAALRKGFEVATGDIIAVQDADFEYDPEDLNELLKPIIANKADVVFGSRFRRTSPQVHRTFHYMVNRFLTFLSNLFSGLYLTDMETCYKVFRADIIKNLHLSSNRFGFEPEVTAAISKLRVRVHEYAISYYPRSHFEGKKIGWKDGVAALWFIFKYNIQPLNAKSSAKLPKRYLR